MRSRAGPRGEFGGCNGARLGRPAVLGKQLCRRAPGELLAQASVAEEAVLLVDLDLDRSEAVRRWWPFLRDRRIDAYGELLKRWRT